MDDNGNDQQREHAQQTPTGHTIPVPSREQVLRDFEKVAKAKPSRRAGRPIPKRKPEDRP